MWIDTVQSIQPPQQLVLICAEEALKIPEGFQFPQKVMLVRFEDLAKDTIGKMSEIFNALEVSTDYW